MIVSVDVAILIRTMSYHPYLRARTRLYCLGRVYSGRWHLAFFANLFCPSFSIEQLTMRAQSCPVSLRVVSFVFLSWVFTIWVFIFLAQLVSPEVDISYCGATMHSRFWILMKNLSSRRHFCHLCGSVFRFVGNSILSLLQCFPRLISVFSPTFISADTSISLPLQHHLN